MRLANYTPCPHQLLLWCDKDGRDWCSIVVKATCRLSTGALLEAQMPIAPADELAASGAVSRPADVATRRTGTSVVVKASIWASRDTPAPQTTARVRVGPVEKRITAFGPRTWTKKGGAYVPSSSVPFVSVPATLEHAFGGRNANETYHRNPVGSGLCPDDVRRDGQSLPQLEDPSSPLRTSEDRPPPAAYDATPATFSPRLERAGTYDETWRRRRAPLLPVDFDDRYFDVASEGLVARPFLKGGETVELDALHPDGAIRTCVPRLPLRIDVNNVRRLPDLDLVVIEPDEDRLTLTFRQTCPVPTDRLALPNATILLLVRRPKVEQVARE